MSSDILVIKRDGSKEPFDPEKISRVVQAAGLEVDLAQKLTRDISIWINALGQSEVSSLKIRDEVITELESLDEYVAGLFRWYQKTKDLSYPDSKSSSSSNS
jgi:transcriptional regulator NrdR family protein